MHSICLSSPYYLNPHPFVLYTTICYSLRKQASMAQTLPRTLAIILVYMAPVKHTDRINDFVFVYIIRTLIVELWLNWLKPYAGIFHLIKWRKSFITAAMIMGIGSYFMMWTSDSQTCSHDPRLLWHKWSSQIQHQPFLINLRMFVEQFIVKILWIYLKVTQTL